MLEDDGRYESLMNTSPLTSSPGASDSLRGLSGAMSQFRSQSRLGMLDTQIGGSRRRPSAPPVPDASFDVPTPPDASRRNTDIFRAMAAKIARDPEMSARFEVTGNPQQDLPQIAGQLRSDFGAYMSQAYGMK